MKSIFDMIDKPSPATHERNIERYHAALNEVAQRWCKENDAFTLEKAAELLKNDTDRYGSEEYAVAELCGVAYGGWDITVRDLFNIFTHEERKMLSQAGGKLRHASVEHHTALADLVDVLVRHWYDFDADEKAIVSTAVTGVLNNAKPEQTA